MASGPGFGVPFSSPSTIVPDVSKEPLQRLSSASSGSVSSSTSTFTLTSTSTPAAVSCSPGVQKLVQAAAASPFSLSLPSTSIPSTPKSSSLVPPPTSLTRKISAPATTVSPEHKTGDARTVWLSFRPGAMFIRCIVHPVHIFYLLVRQPSASEWQVVELNQENRKRMISGEPLKRSIYSFNDKHKIELCSLGELDTLPIKKPQSTSSNFSMDLGDSLSGSWAKETGRPSGFNQDNQDDFALEDLGDLPSCFTEELDMRMNLHD